jgi:hypothetical protein
MHEITVDPASAANISHTQEPQNLTEHPHKLLAIYYYHYYYYYYSTIML